MKNSTKFFVLIGSLFQELFEVQTGAVVNTGFNTVCKIKNLKQVRHACIIY